jgi:hypothetical protein
MLIKQVFDLFGPNLPDKDTFFATTANPMSLLDLRREGWKTWENFINEFQRFAMEQTKKNMEPKTGALPKGVTKDAT